MTDDENYEVGTGGPNRAPRSLFSRLIRTFLGFIVVVAGIWIVVVAAGALPRQTGLSNLILRGAIGLSIGLVLTLLVRRMMRAFGESPPPAPMKFDARETDVVYECPVCGTRVRLEVAATAKAPKHCGEEMEAKLVAP